MKRRTWIGWIAAGLLGGVGCAAPAWGRQDGKTVGRRETPAQLPDTGRNWLICVGVDVFPRDSTVSTLRYAVADAEAVFLEFTRAGGLVPRAQAFLLTSPRGSQAPAAPSNAPNDKERYPADRTEILERIQDVAERAPADGLIVVYVSTHGFVDDENQAYFMPSDGRCGLNGRSLKDTAVSVARLNEILGKSRATKRILIIDACRNNPNAPADTRGNAAPMADAFEKALRAARGQVVLSSCAAGERSNEPADSDRPVPQDAVPPPSRQGIYTHYLLEGLRGAAPANPDGFVSLFTLQDFVSKKVEAWCARNGHRARQTPWWQGGGTRDIPLAILNAAPANPPQPEPDRTPPERIRPPQPPAGVNGKTLILDLGGGVTMELVRIEAGEFWMGSPDDETERFYTEGPRHRVKISKSFYLGKYEVTQKQWRAVMGNNPSYFKGDDLPVERVSWDDCQEFCRKLALKVRREVRLPTEAEWEYACRAGTTTRFSFSDADDALSEYAWFDKNSDDKTHPVGKKKPNIWGLYDMHGNVWEWCQDYWKGDYEDSPQIDPTGPGSGSDRVWRGGTYDDGPGFLRAAIRYSNPPDRRLSFLGLRVVATESAAGSP